MVSLCDDCIYRYDDCKGNKDIEKTKCPYYKKPQVFNAKEAAERIAELEAENKMLRIENDYLKHKGELPF